MLQNTFPALNHSALLKNPIFDFCFYGLHSLFLFLLMLWFQWFELARQSIPRLAAVHEWAPICKLVSYQTIIVIIIIILENEKYISTKIRINLVLSVKRVRMMTLLCSTKIFAFIHSHIYLCLQSSRAFAYSYFARNQFSRIPSSQSFTINTL
jgi:hypothetical protein